MRTSEQRKSLFAVQSTLHYTSNPALRWSILTQNPKNPLLEWVLRNILIISLFFWSFSISNTRKLPSMVSQILKYETCWIRVSNISSLYSMIHTVWSGPAKERNIYKCTCSDRAFNTLVLKSNLVVRVVHARIQILVTEKFDMQFSLTYLVMIKTLTSRNLYLV